MKRWFIALIILTGGAALVWWLWQFLKPESQQQRKLRQQEVLLDTLQRIKRLSDEQRTADADHEETASGRLRGQV